MKTGTHSVLFHFVRPLYTLGWDFGDNIVGNEVARVDVCCTVRGIDKYSQRISVNVLFCA